MPAKRSNKTARVLNLIATPSETMPVEHEQPAAPAAPAETQPAPAETQAAPTATHKEKTRSSTPKTKKAAKATATAPASAEPAAETPSTALESPAAEQPQAAPIPTPQPVVPIVQTVREKEQQVSDDIKSGLLQALSESEAPTPPPEPTITDEPQTSIADTTKQDVTESAVAEPEAMETAAPEPAATQTPPEATPSPAPQPEKAAPLAEQPEPVQPTVKAPQPKAPSEDIYTPAGEQNVEYTNVLQELVEETSLYYIANMLQCHCQRCIADMKALALTNLPSKYVVLEKSKRAAYMSVYAARYEKELSVQMMRACVIINEHPHH